MIGFVLMEKVGEVKMDEEMYDIEFLANIISTICGYAVEHKMRPDDVLSAITDRIQSLLKVATFNGWGNKDDRRVECES